MMMKKEENLNLKNIKMVVSDMDGTLLNKEHRLSEKTIEMMKKLQKHGVILVLASGRSIHTLEPLGKQMDMHLNQNYYICVNGEKIVRSDTLKQHCYQQLSPLDIQKVMNFVKPYEVEIMAVQDASIYDYIPQSMMKEKETYRKENNIKEDVPYTAGTFSMVVDQRKGYDHIEYIKDIDAIDIDANKMCIAHQPEILNSLYDQLITQLGDQFNFVKTSPTWIECMPYGVDKAVCLQNLMDDLHITKDEVIVFGDGENDLSMFSVSTHSVAMINGMEKVKQNATYISDYTNNEDGVVRFLMEIGLSLKVMNR